MRVLGVIPARGGSKGVPRKNIRLLAGKPLILFTIESALASTRLSRVILSTDDPEIADVGRRAGAEVPFMRPSELARDDSPTLPVLQHAVQALEKAGSHFDAVCLLQPTSPLRAASLIDTCIDKLVATGADSVVTILPVPPEYNPHWVYFQSPDGFLRLSTGETSPIPRRQALPPAFHREGSVYVTRRDVLLHGNSLYGNTTVGVLLEPAASVNLDTLRDWDRAEELLAGRTRR